MLGRHADAFFKKQATERIVANQPNGRAQSIDFPDRESPGTHVVGRVQGAYETPGPQTVVNANSMLPSMGEIMPSTNPKDMLPGMGEEPVANPKDMLPGMGMYANPKDMLPGMGFLPSNMTTLALLGAAAVGIWYFGFRKGA